LEAGRFMGFHNDCQNIFPLWHMLQKPKSPLPPLSKGGNLADSLGKSPFEKGGFRGI
jgi:hypothetical protein